VFELVEQGGDKAQVIHIRVQRETAANARIPRPPNPLGIDHDRSMGGPHLVESGDRRGLVDGIQGCMQDHNQRHRPIGG
jgi:hypothetical protein